MYFKDMFAIFLCLKYQASKFSQFLKHQIKCFLLLNDKVYIKSILTAKIGFKMLNRVEIYFLFIIAKAMKRHKKKSPFYHNTKIQHFFETDQINYVKKC
jgi:hypothetical protein